MVQARKALLKEMIVVMKNEGEDVRGGKRIREEEYEERRRAKTVK